jgi:hypothetical protein
MSLTNNESIGASARLGVMRLASSRLGAVVTTDELDKDSDGTYAWKRQDGEPRLGAPGTVALASGAWTVNRGDT